MTKTDLGLLLAAVGVLLGLGLSAEVILAALTASATTYLIAPRR